MQNISYGLPSGSYQGIGPLRLALAPWWPLSAQEPTIPSVSPAAGLSGMMSGMELGTLFGGTATGLYAGLGMVIGTSATLLVPPLAQQNQVSTITFGHGARHLAGTGLNAEMVEGTIMQSIQQITANASVTGTFWGRIVVQNLMIEYRAFTLDNGVINVGTYYPVFP